MEDRFLSSIYLSTAIVTKVDLGNYLSANLSNNFALSSDLSNYLSANLSNNFALSSDLSNYLKLSAFVSSDFVNKKIDNSLSGNLSVYQKNLDVISGSFKQSNSDNVLNYSDRNSFIQAEEAKSGSGSSYGAAYTGTKGYCILSVNNTLKEIKLDGNISAIQNLLDGRYIDHNGETITSVINTPALKILYKGSYQNNYSFSDIKFSFALDDKQGTAEIRPMSVVESTSNYGIISVDNIPTELWDGAKNKTEAQLSALFVNDDNALYAIGYPELGNQLIANFYAQHAEGGSVRAIGKYTHTEGRDTVADMRYAHAEGSHTIAGGMASHAEGFYNLASGRFAHVEGQSSKAIGKGSHAEGLSSIANGEMSHSEGSNNIADGNYSHAEGFGNVTGIGNTVDSTNTSIGFATHAEGIANKASNVGSHVEGHFNTTAGNFSHAEGVGSINYPSNLLFSFYANSTLLSVNNSSYQLHVYDIINHNTNYRSISDIGYTDDNKISSITINSALSSSKSDLFENITLGILSGGVAFREAAHVEGKYNLAIGSHSHAEGAVNRAVGNQSHAEGYMTSAIGIQAHSEGVSTLAIGNISHVEGINTVAGNENKRNASTSTTIGQYTHAEGNGTLAKGNSSHAEGKSTQAIGSSSHAEGNSVSAISAASHAEGFMTIASGNQSHAEGEKCEASGQASHAEGQETAAAAKNSHTSGYKTSADAVNSFVIGRYAHSLKDHNNTFVWQGVNDNVAYESHGAGTFNINPTDGLSGIYIGEENLDDKIKEYFKTEFPGNDEEGYPLKITFNHDDEMVGALSVDGNAILSGTHFYQNAKTVDIKYYKPDSLDYSLIINSIPIFEQINKINLICKSTIDVAIYHCLSPDTRILMHDMSEKMLKDIVIGDKILAIDPKTGSLVEDIVIKTHAGVGSAVDIWEFEDGTKVETIGRHRFYNIDLQEFMYLEAWNKDESAKNINGKSVKLIKHENVAVENAPHATLFTAKYNNYFANGLLAGNRHSVKLNMYF